MLVKSGIAAGAITIIGALLLLAALLPAVSDHFGYARPGSNGLPFRFNIDGVVYEDLRLCRAVPPTCSPTRARWSKLPHDCASIQFLVQQNLWPLAGPIASIPTLLGASHGVYRYLPDGRLYPVWAYVKDGDCYVPYIRAEDGA